MPKAADHTVKASNVQPVYFRALLLIFCQQSQNLQLTILKRRSWL